MKKNYVCPVVENIRLMGNKTVMDEASGTPSIDWGSSGTILNTSSHM